MKAAETPSPHSKHGEIPKTDCSPGSNVTWKLGQSVESIEEKELEKPDASQSENNNNDGGNGGDSRHLQRISSNCVRLTIKTFIENPTHFCNAEFLQTNICIKYINILYANIFTFVLPFQIQRSSPSRV